MGSDTILRKFESLPEGLRKQAADYIEFLIEKETKKRESKGENRKTPTFGSAKGMFRMAPDFDEPLDDFKEYMY